MLALITALLVSTSAVQEVSASDASVELPPSEQTSTRAFVVVRNPTMYDVYVVSASAADVAASIELKNGDNVVKEMTVAAYGTLRMKPDGAHLLLTGLKRELNKDDTVSLTLTTDGNVKLRTKAIVR